MNSNLAVDRTFFIDCLFDDKCKLQSNCGCSGVIEVQLSCMILRLLDKMPPLIGEKLGGGNKFNWLGVNERRLRIDVAYGDKYMFDSAWIIGDNGNNGEFGVCTRLYSDILLFFRAENDNKMETVIVICSNLNDHWLTWSKTAKKCKMRITIKMSTNECF